MTPASLLKVEDSLSRVRAGLESRALRIEGRVGRELAAFVARPGKMLRSRFCLLLGGALGVPRDKAEAAARALELVHNASLLHDDCIDEATLRRSRPTPNALFNIPTALLIGDLAFSQGLEEAVDVSPSAAKLLAAAVREMSVGELQEEFLKGDADLTVDAYIGVCSRKTGALFEWAGAVLSELSPFPHEQADPPRLACAAGILLQVVDDIHDYTLGERVSGKDEGQDVKNRRLTLPCLYALADARAREEFLKLWRGGDATGVGRFLVEGGFVAKARGKGRELADSMTAMARALPCRAEASQLAFFIDLLVKREF